MTMDVLPPYRVITRFQAYTMVAVIFALGALAVWLSTVWLDGYLARMDAVMRSNAQEAADSMVAVLKVIAFIHVAPLFAFCAFMLWYCRRAIATQSLPPAGSWIVEGQPIRTGASAVRSAWIALALTGIVAIAGIAASVYIYSLASSLQERAAGA